VPQRSELNKIPVTYADPWPESRSAQASEARMKPIGIVAFVGEQMLE
jgi:hypothetical protein